MEHLPAVRVSLRVVRVDADRLVEVGKRLLIAPGAAEHAAAHVVGLRVVRIALDDFGEPRRQIVDNLRQGRWLHGLMREEFFRQAGSRKWHLARAHMV